jgi:RAB protein geranylgeranyltransferase component A
MTFQDNTEYVHAVDAACKYKCVEGALISPPPLSLSPRYSSLGEIPPALCRSEALTGGDAAG